MTLKTLSKIVIRAAPVSVYIGIQHRFAFPAAGTDLSTARPTRPWIGHALGARVAQEEATELGGGEDDGKAPK